LEIEGDLAFKKRLSDFKDSGSFSYFEKENPILFANLASSFLLFLLRKRKIKILRITIPKPALTIQMAKSSLFPEDSLAMNACIMNNQHNQFHDARVVFLSPISFIVSLSTRSWVERIDMPKGKGKICGMKFFQIILLLIIPLISGCWHPMDLSPAATLEKRSHTPVSSLDHLRGAVDNEVTEEFHGILPES
jgi:hypothetical protein